MKKEPQASSDEDIHDMDDQGDGSDNDEFSVTNVTNEGKNCTKLLNNMCTILYSQNIFVFSLHILFFLVQKMKEPVKLKMKKVADQILVQEKGKRKGIRQICLLIYIIYQNYIAILPYCKHAKRSCYYCHKINIMLSYGS